MVDQLVHRSGVIDVYIISGEASPAPTPEEIPWRPHPPWRRYIWAALLVVAATGLSRLLNLRISPTNLVMIYLLTVVVAATYLGRGPAVLASFLSVLAFDYFFVPPSFTFAVSDTEYLLTFGGLLIVGFVISQLTARVRDQAEAAERREADTSALYALSREMAVAGDLDDILKAIATQVEQTFGREVVVYLPKTEEGGSLVPHTLKNQPGPSVNELAVAVWAFQHAQPAGRGTDTLSAAEARYLPLKTARGVVGVLGVKPLDPGNQLSPELRRLLEAFANQAALAIERAQLVEQARQVQLSQTTEKLQTALLNSISHDLRTPLVTITGALSALDEECEGMDRDSRGNLLTVAREEADRLNRLVGNLLNMTRIESGALRVTFEPRDIQDLIGAALEQMKDRLLERQVSVDIPNDLPLVPMDFVLLVQVFANLLDNAIKYSEPDSTIEIAAQVSGAYVQVEVRDRGVGIPHEDLGRVFDKFYRVQRPDNVSGSGLGLAICRGIVEAHGGFIGAENRPGGGTTITVSLPIEQRGSANAGTVKR
jgi:two-component system sensor histidine kinase KdpD